MGFTTAFKGSFHVEPPLSAEHARYLQAFAETLHIKRSPRALEKEPDPAREAVGLPLGEDGCYFVGDVARGEDASYHSSVIDYTAQPGGQPSLRCQWVPSTRKFVMGSEGASMEETSQWIEWDGEEKFYGYVEWLEYMIKHFLEPWAYKLTGTVEWEGEDGVDRGVISVSGNRVEATGQGGGEEEEELDGAGLDEAIELLRRPDVDAQRETIDMLLCLAFGNPLFVEALKEVVLTGRHEWVRLDAAEALGSMGEHATSSAPQLIRALDDANEYVAAAAACSLGQIGSTDPAVKQALEAAKESDRYAVRERATQALEKLT